MEINKQELINEEQMILDQTIEEINRYRSKVSERRSRNIMERKRAKEQDQPEAYGTIIQSNNIIEDSDRELEEIDLAKSSLYERRIIVDCIDSNGRSKDLELKIGKHALSKEGRIYVTSWASELAIQFARDQYNTEYENMQTDKDGEVYRTKYNLKLKRKVEIENQIVTDAIHLFPLTKTEHDRLIFDKFLMDLLKRKRDKKFRDIIFTIQKKQMEIITRPFNENLIVQGCAGSGKSMIMLHRLPVLLNNKGYCLKKDSIYIITPSQTYMDLADDLMAELEISDIQSGTIYQYYLYCIKKYQKSFVDVGIIDSSISLSNEQTEYLYSDSCIQDINVFIDKIIGKPDRTYKEGIELFNIKDNQTVPNIPIKILRHHIKQIGNIINENSRRINNSYKFIRDIVNDTRALNSRLLVEEKKSDKEDNKIKSIMNKIRNQMEKDENTKDAQRFEELLIIYSALKKSEEESEYKKYVELYRVIQKIIGQNLPVNVRLKNNSAEYSKEELYKLISNVSKLKKMFHAIEDEMYEFQFQNGKISKMDETQRETLKLIQKYIEETDKHISLFDGMNIKLLNYKYYEELVSLYRKLSNIEKQIEYYIFFNILSKLNIKKETNKKPYVPYDAVFLFLQILYQFRGKPDKKQESLIMIDEVQNVSPEEIKLIRNINNKTVVLNLFGDIRQHVEGSKGLEDWKQLRNICNFNKYILEHNYRNAGEITEYCNLNLSTNMKTLHLSGQGCIEFKDIQEFDENIKKIIDEDTEGLKAVIVKDSKELQNFAEKYSMYKDRFYVVEDIDDTIDDEKWNLLKVKDSKGLEFSKVIAISGQMSTNEKYITYTRALEKLYICGQKL